MIITETEHGHERSDCQRKIGFECLTKRTTDDGFRDAFAKFGEVVHVLLLFHKECLILLRTVTVGTTYSTPGVCYASTAVGNNGEGSRAVHNEGKHRFSRKNGKATAIAFHPTSITDP
ncbi:hypothetical protein Tco_1203241 [Tanacetum coccineum]